MTKAISVTQLNQYIKQKLKNDENLNHILVEGEISNFKAQSSGHLYFGIKDEKNSYVNCVMFRGSAGKLKFKPENGQKVLIRGHIDLYEPTGKYQVIAESMDVAGLGDLYLAFEQMKEKLSKEGLFDESYKKPIPLFSRKIGVVTSPTGAVWHDIQNVSTSRFPDIELYLYPAAVQGDAAIGEIIAGIEYFNKTKSVDLLIVGRGGGSLEDLWAFNTEPVARAIFKSALPVISAVGHETDVTIADMVADKRAATPSHAAEMAVPSLSELRSRLSGVENALTQCVSNGIKNRRSILEKIAGSYIFTEKDAMLQSYYTRLDRITDRLEHTAEKNMSSYRSKLEVLKSKLGALSPLNTLERGYAVALADKQIIRDAVSVKAGDDITVLLNHGYLNCTVKESKEESYFGN